MGVLLLLLPQQNLEGYARICCHMVILAQLTSSIYFLLQYKSSLCYAKKKNQQKTTQNQQKNPHTKQKNPSTLNENVFF